jgi:tRNA(fMet)-specific endonuclease VapC
MGRMETLMFVCLDTSFLIDFLRGDEASRTAYLKLKSEGFRFATTTINAFELFRGVDKRGRRKAEEEGVQRLLARLVVWNFDISAAERVSSVYTDLERTSHPINVGDCLTAAIAISNGCQKIISRDSHFKKIPALELIP